MVKNRFTFLNEKQSISRRIEDVPMVHSLDKNLSAEKIK